VGTTPTSIGIIVALGAKPTTISTPTLRADKAVGVQMPFQPDQAQTIVKQIRDQKIDRAVLLRPHVYSRWDHTNLARLLDMSRRF
jgi:hypothetical protein